MGLFTQYYFVFYAAFLCAAVCLYMLIKKQYKSGICLALFAMLGVACLLIAFPACIDHIFFANGDVSGETAISNLLNIFNNRMKIINYLRLVIRSMLPAVIVGVAAVILIIKNGSFQGIKNIFRENDSFAQSLIIIVPAFIALLFIAIITPYMMLRYVYNICPIIVLTVSLAIYILGKTNIKKPLLLNDFAILLIVLSLVMLYLVKPENLYQEYRRYNDIIDEYTELPCVCFDNNYNPPLANDLPQLMKFNDVFVTNDTNSQAMKDYLKTYGDPDEIIVYIDINKKHSSGYNADEILGELAENTEYKNHEKLFSSFVSETYKVSK